MARVEEKGFYVEPERLIPMVERLQRGETSVNDEIRGVFYYKILGHVHKKIQDWETAKDLVEMIFKEIQRKIGILREPAAFVGWCNRIVIAKCNDYHRNKYREEARKERELRTRSEPKYTRRRLTEDEKNLLRSKLDQIPPKQAYIMELHYIEERSVEDIARLTDIPAGTVKSRLHYGRLSFRQLVKPPTTSETN